MSIATANLEAKFVHGFLSLKDDVINLKNVMIGKL